MSATNFLNIDVRRFLESLQFVVLNILAILNINFLPYLEFYSILFLMLQQEVLYKHKLNMPRCDI